MPRPPARHGRRGQRHRLHHPGPVGVRRAGAGPASDQGPLSRLPPLHGRLLRRRRPPPQEHGPGPGHRSGLERADHRGARPRRLVAAVWPLLRKACRWTTPTWSPSGRLPARPICPSCSTPSPSRRRTSPATATSGTTPPWPLRRPDLGGQRFLSFMLMGGMLDRYPNLRVGTLESGHGWLPHWLQRLTRQIDYVRGSVSPTSSTRPSSTRRWAASSAASTSPKGAALTKAVIDLMGDHTSCSPRTIRIRRPSSPTTPTPSSPGARRWGGGHAEAYVENAARFLRLTSTPWG